MPESAARTGRWVTDDEFPAQIMSDRKSQMDLVDLGNWNRNEGLDTNLLFLLFPYLMDEKFMGGVGRPPMAVLVAWLHQVRVLVADDEDGDPVPIETTMGTKDGVKRRALAQLESELQRANYGEYYADLQSAIATFLADFDLNRTANRMLDKLADFTNSGDAEDEEEFRAEVVRCIVS